MLVVYKEHHWFSGVLRGYELGTLARNGLRILAFYILVRK